MLRKPMIDRESVISVASVGSTAIALRSASPMMMNSRSIEDRSHLVVRNFSSELVCASSRIARQASSMSNRYFSISGCIELSLCQLDRLPEEWIVDSGHADEIDRASEQLLDRELEVEVRMPAITPAARVELDDEVDIAAGRVERAFYRGAEYGQPLDAVSAAELANLVQMIGDDGWQRSHIEIVPLRGAQSYNRVTAGYGR